MAHSFAVRTRSAEIDLDATIGYRSPVPLFASGAEAAAHGMRDIQNPGLEARAAASHLARVRSRRTTATCSHPDDLRSIRIDHGSFDWTADGGREVIEPLRNGWEEWRTLLCVACRTRLYQLGAAEFALAVLTEGGGGHSYPGDT